MSADLIEELAAVKDKFPAGSLERSVIWTAIEHLRGENAEIVRLRGEVDAATTALGEHVALTYPSIAPAAAKGDAVALFRDKCNQLFDIWTGYPIEEVLRARELLDTPQPAGGEAVAINYAVVHRFATEHGVDYNRLAKLVRDSVYTTPPAVQVQQEAVALDPQLARFYDVDSVPALLAAMESHIEKLQDAARRNVKPWEDTFPPTLLPKYLRDSGLQPTHPTGDALGAVRELAAQLVAEINADKGRDYTNYELGRIAEKQRQVGLLQAALRPSAGEGKV